MVHHLVNNPLCTKIAMHYCTPYFQPHRLTSMPMDAAFALRKARPGYGTWCLQPVVFQHCTITVQCCQLYDFQPSDTILTFMIYDRDVWNVQSFLQCLNLCAQLMGRRLILCAKKNNSSAPRKKFLPFRYLQQILKPLLRVLRMFEWYIYQGSQLLRFNPDCLDFELV